MAEKAAQTLETWAAFLRKQEAGKSHAARPSSLWHVVAVALSRVSAQARAIRTCRIEWWGPLRKVEANPTVPARRRGNRSGASSALDKNGGKSAMNVKSEIIGLLAAGLLAGPMPAGAVTQLAELETAVFNFDLGPSTDPWYTAYLNATGIDPLDRVLVRWFRDYDAVEQDYFAATSGPLWELPHVSAFTSELQDGTFSIKVYASIGSFSVDPCVARGTEWPATGTCYAPISAVSEPGTLALLGLGLTGLALSRKRKTA